MAGSAFAASMCAMTTRSQIQRLVLSLGALAVALAGLLVPLHMVLAHHCPAHTPAKMDDCAICLHWQHQAAEQAQSWAILVPTASGIMAPEAPCRAGHVDRPTIQVRGPPARV